MIKEPSVFVFLFFCFFTGHHQDCYGEKKVSFRWNLSLCFLVHQQKVKQPLSLQHQVSVPPRYCGRGNQILLSNDVTLARIERLFFTCASWSANRFVVSSYATRTGGFLHISSKPVLFHVYVEAKI